MLSKIILSLSFCLFNFSVYAGRDAYQDYPEPNVIETVKRSMVNIAAPAYYLTSVAGYSTTPLPLLAFYENYFNNLGWEHNKFEETLPSSTLLEDSFKENLVGSGNFYPNIQLEKGNIQVSYFYQQNEDHVKILSSAKKLTYFTQVVEGQQFVHHMGSDCFSALSSSLNRSTAHFMEHVFQKFPNKRIILYSVVQTSVILGVKHLCYLELDINNARTTINIDVTDPCFKIPMFSFGPQQIKEFFDDVSKELGLTPTYSHHYRNDQILNRHDCGRFSTIYLLRRLQGLSLRSLSTFDIYLGFKFLEKGGVRKLSSTSFS